MAERFNLTAQLQLQAPTNVRQVASTIQKQLGGAGNVKVKVDANTKSLARANSDMQNFAKNTKAARKQVRQLSRNIEESARRFGVITLATGTLIGFTNALKNGVKQAIEFEREVVKISQVTGKTAQQLSGLTREVDRLSISLGVSSSDLLEVSRTLLQTGLSAEKTKQALEVLAKTSLAATFDSIQDTTEGAIALLRQFGDQAVTAGGDIKFLEKSLDAINSVSKKFAVESGDIITAIRKTGGVFAAAGGQVEELIALFTSVRATTRESADTIATGLRTIFTRIQRVETIDQLKSLGIQLQDSQGRFVGAYKAFQRLSTGLAALDARDYRFSEIVESLGGFRQVGKVIPLIQQFTTSQNALNVAINASGSISKDAETAQQSLANKIAKTSENFAKLLRTFTDSKAFRELADFALSAADGFIKFAASLEKVLPLITALLTVKVGAGIAGFAGRMIGGAFGRSAAGPSNYGPVSKFATGGKVLGFNDGGLVPGTGNRDTVPAMLTPGEFVIKKGSVAKMGTAQLEAMNQNRRSNGSSDREKAQPKKAAKAAADEELLSEEESGLKNSTISYKNDKSKIGFYYLSAGTSPSNKAPGTSVLSSAARKDVNGSKELGFTPDTIDGSGKKSGLTAATKTRLGWQKGDRIKYDFDSSVGTLAEEPSKEFSSEIASGISAALAGVSNTIAEKYEVALPFKGDPKEAAEKASKSITKEQLQNIEGSLFENFVSSFSGSVQGEEKAGIDIPSFNVTQRAALQAISDGDTNLSGVNAIEVKKSYSKESYSTPSKEGSFFNKMWRIASGESNVNQAQVGMTISQSDENGPQDRIGPVSTAKARTKLNTGGSAGVGSPQDTIPALLTPGEFVINRDAASRIGTANLNMMNKYGVSRFNSGGSVGPQRFSGGSKEKVKQRGGGGGLRLGEGEVGGFGALLEVVDKVTVELEKISDIGGQTAESLRDISEISVTERAASGLSGKSPERSAQDLALGESRDKRRQEQLAEKESRRQEKFGTGPVKSSPGKNATKFNVNSLSGDSVAKLAKVQGQVSERLEAQGATAEQARKAGLIYRREILNGAKKTEAYATAVEAVSPEMLSMLKEAKNSKKSLKSLGSAAIKGAKSRVSKRVSELKSAGSAGIKKASEINEGGIGGLIENARNLFNNPPNDDNPPSGGDSSSGGGPPDGPNRKQRIAAGINNVAEGFDRIAGSVQSFVFLGAGATALASQFLGLDESTGKVVNELAALSVSVIGMAGTVAQVVTSTIVATTSILANTTARNVNTVAMLKGAGALAGITAAIAGGILVMEYWSRTAREEADKISGRRKKSIDDFKEGKGSRPDTDVLVRGIEAEARARQQSADYAVTTSKGFQIAGAGLAGAAVGIAATAGAFALAGSAVPVLGTAIGAVVGAVVGVGIYLANASSNIEAAIDAGAVARKREAEALKESYDAFFDLIDAQNAFKNKIQEIESTVGISEEESTKRKLEAFENNGRGFSEKNTANIDTAKKARAATVSRLQNEIRDNASAKVNEAKESGIEGEELGKLIADIKNKSETGVREVARISQTGGSEEDIREDLEKLGIAAASASTGAIALDLSSQKTAQTLKAAGEQEAVARDLLGKSMASIDFNNLESGINQVNRANDLLIESVMAKRDAEIASAETKDQKTKIAKQYAGVIEAQNKATNERVEKLRENKAAMDLEIEARRALTAQMRQQRETMEQVSGANMQAERDLRDIDFNAAVAAGQAPNVSLDAPVLSGISTEGVVQELKGFRSSLALVSEDLKTKGAAAAESFETTTKNIAAAQGLVGKNITIENGETAGSDAGKELAKGAGLSESQVSELFGGSSQSIEKFYADLADSANKVGGITESDIEGLLKPAKARAETDAKIIANINKIANLGLQSAQKTIKAEQAARQRGIASIDKFNSINDTLSEKLAEITGDTSIDRVKNEKESAQRKLDAGEKSRGGRILFANDPSQAARVRDQAQKDIKNVQGQIQNARRTDATDDEKESLEGLTRKLQELQNTVADSEAELERFATSTSKLDAIQEKLAQATAAREQGFSVISDFVTGGKAERETLNSGAAGIFSAIRTNTTQNLSDEQRKNTFGLLDQLSEVENVFGSGKKGKDLKQELIVNDAIKLGFDPAIAKQLATQTTTEEKLLEEAKAQTALMRKAAGLMLTDEQRGLINKSSEQTEGSGVGNKGGSAQAQAQAQSQAQAQAQKPRRNSIAGIEAQIAGMEEITDLDGEMNKQDTARVANLKRKKANLEKAQAAREAKKQAAKDRTKDRQDAPLSEEEQYRQDELAVKKFQADQRNAASRRAKQGEQERRRQENKEKDKNRLSPKEAYNKRQSDAAEQAEKERLMAQFDAEAKRVVAMTPAQRKKYDNDQKDRRRSEATARKTADQQRESTRFLSNGRFSNLDDVEINRKNEQAKNDALARSGGATYTLKDGTEVASNPLRKARSDGSTLGQDVAVDRLRTFDMLGKIQGVQDPKERDPLGYIAKRDEEQAQYDKSLAAKQASRKQRRQFDSEKFQEGYLPSELREEDYETSYLTKSVIPKDENKFTPREDGLFKRAFGEFDPKMASFGDQLDVASGSKYAGATLDDAKVSNSVKYQNMIYKNNPGLEDGMAVQKYFASGAGPRQPGEFFPKDGQTKQSGEALSGGLLNVEASLGSGETIMPSYKAGTRPNAVGGSQRGSTLADMMPEHPHSRATGNEMMANYDFNGLNADTAASVATMDELMSNADFPDLPSGYNRVKGYNRVNSENIEKARQERARAGSQQERPKNRPTYGPIDDARWNALVDPAFNKENNRRAFDMTTDQFASGLDSAFSATPPMSSGEVNKYQSARQRSQDRFKRFREDENSISAAPANNSPTAPAQNGENTAQSGQNSFAEMTQGLNNIVTQFSTVSSALSGLEKVFQDGIQVNHNFTGDMSLALKIENSDQLKAALGDAITPRIKELIEEMMGENIPQPPKAG